MTHILPRLAALFALLVLAACAAPPDDMASPTVVPGYGPVQDGEFFIPAVEPQYLAKGYARTEVDYAGDDAPGTVIVDTFARRLYFVLEGGRALRYSIAVGREGLAFRGSGVINRKEEWPSWTPTANMVRTRPDLYAAYAGGLPGGLENPLGARALYLYRNGRDTYFRIHGTIQNATIGHATSAGCIRLFNQDAIDLYERVDFGARVNVRTLEESIAIEGPFMNDATGRAVPETPENIAKRDSDMLTMADDEIKAVALAAAEAEEAEKEAARANKKRLAACRRQGIGADDCPELPFDGAPSS